MQSEGAKSRREFFRKNSIGNVASTTLDESEMSTAHERIKLMSGLNREERNDVVIKSPNLSNDSAQVETASVRNKSREAASSPNGHNNELRNIPNRHGLPRRSLTDPGDDGEDRFPGAIGQIDRKALHSRSSSSPSLVLSRVKEKIRKKVVKASDWRDSKAMALEKFSSTPPLSGARSRQDKRRTLSEASSRPDSSTSLRSVTSTEELPALDKQKTGIVCSSKDLEAILGSLSPTNSKPKVNKTVSLELSSESSKPNKDKLKRNSSGTVCSTKKLTTPVLSPTNKGTAKTGGDDEANVISEMSLIESLLKPQVVKDIEFDDQGETWEIYGADFDPEVLGDAIQKHLQRIDSCDIEEKETFDRNKNDIKRSSKNKAQSAWHRMFDAVRQRHKKSTSS